MKVLALDPGAVRCGWAVLESEGEESRQKKYVASGIYGLDRNCKYQDYRLALIEYWVWKAQEMLNNYDVLFVVSEVVPPTGGNLASIINRQLALTVVTTVQAVAHTEGCLLAQIGATTVKKKVGGVGKASKVKVRDGVLSMLPELEYRRSDWTGKNAVYDEVDAIAIGLTYLDSQGSIG